MPSLRVTAAPQLSRLLTDVPTGLVAGFLKSETVRDLVPLKGRAEDSLEELHAALVGLPRDDLTAVEREAVRVVQLSTPRADALHLRFAASPQFDCSATLEDQHGSLARALWAYQSMPALFVATERAMQVRSFRDHGRIFQAYEVQTPRDVAVEDLDGKAFADDIAARLDLSHGCRADAVELPGSGASPRQIMIAVTAGGARENQKTFEDDQSVGFVRFRPANELILVYLPEFGRIEVCGRQWADRKVVADAFARDILHEDLSTRPLTSRTYDLAPFRGPLDFDVPEALRDRVRSVCVTEVRVALGSYDRKVTLTVTPGEKIEVLRQAVFGALRSRHGRGFVCDVELHMKVILPGMAEKQLRFRINNHNSSTLQSQADPDLRAVGFDLLGELGVVRMTREADGEERQELLQTLLRLLNHSEDEVAGPELAQMGADIAKLTSTGFLHKKQIVETILIDEEDLGETEGKVTPDLERGRADVSIAPGVVDRTVPLDEVSRWTIHREYILETVTKSLSEVVGPGRLRPVAENVFLIGRAEIDGRGVPVFLAIRLQDDRVLERADRDVRAETELAGGIVFVPGAATLGFLGSHVVVDLEPLVAGGRVELAELELAWRAGSKKAQAASGVSFERLSETRSELIIPGAPVWTIVGDKKSLIVERLYRAHVSGEKMVKTKVLTDYAGVKQLGPTFGAEWKDRIRGNYIYSPAPTFWALAV